MGVNVKKENDVVVLTVEGKLMGEKDTADMIEKVKDSIAEGTTKIVVDLSQAAWLSSTALGVLLKFLLNIASLGWFDRLCGAAFGAVKATLIASVLLFALTTFLPSGTPLIRTSRLAPHVAVITEGIVKIIPKDLKKRFWDKFEKVKQEWEKSA